jgi:hypothetical protein
MATRSAIGFIEYDGSVTGIYCHSDGYISHVGRILKEHYNTIEKVEELLDLGDLSTLGPSIGEKAEFTLDAPDASKQCIAFGRDKGVPETTAITFSNKQEFYYNYLNSGCEYMYLFDGNDWFLLHKNGSLEFV